MIIVFKVRYKNTKKNRLLRFYRVNRTEIWLRAFWMMNLIMLQLSFKFVEQLAKKELQFLIISLEWNQFFFYTADTTQRRHSKLVLYMVVRCIWNQFPL